MLRPGAVYVKNGRQKQNSQCKTKIVDHVATKGSGLMGVVGMCIAHVVLHALRVQLGRGRLLTVVLPFLCPWN